MERKTKETVPVSSSDVRKEEVKEDCPDVEEIKDRGLQRSTSPELEPAIVPPSPETKVDCPICQRSFPARKIEMHAAYCDGEMAAVDERRPENDCFQGDRNFNSFNTCETLEDAWSCSFTTVNCKV